MEKTRSIILPFMAIKLMKNGKYLHERMSKKEVEDFTFFFYHQNKFGGDVVSARILWNNTRKLFRELN